MNVNYKQNVENFEKNMINHYNHILDLCIQSYRGLQKKKAPNHILESAALKIKKLEDQIYKLQMNIGE